jgi:hypothetical protein
MTRYLAYRREDDSVDLCDPGSLCASFWIGFLVGGLTAVWLYLVAGAVMVWGGGG